MTTRTKPPTIQTYSLTLIGTDGLQFPIGRNGAPISSGTLFHSWDKARAAIADVVATIGIEHVHAVAYTMTQVQGGRMVAAAIALVAIADVSSFADVKQITHDSDFVQVTIHDSLGRDRTYARQIRKRNGLPAAWSFSSQMARQIEEAAALVSTPALVAWLVDSGFVLHH